MARMVDKSYTRDWTRRKCESWIPHLQGMIGTPGMRALEIGCFEGRTSCWMMEEVLTTPTSHLICIDPFGYDENTSPEGRRVERENKMSTVKKRFRANVEEYGHRVHLVEMRSQVFLRQLGAVPAGFDLTYVDGEHGAASTLEDLALVWYHVKKGGVVIADDYLWRKNLPDHHRPMLAIDAFVAAHADDLEVLFKGYQVGMRRTR